MEPSYSILLVDDEEITSSLTKKRLGRQSDLTIFCVESGEACLEYLEQHQVDLILLDVSMPGMSGLDVLRHLRKTYRTVELPIIMLSAKGESSDIIEALSAGANDYVTKPIQIEIALARIRTQLNQRDLYKSSLIKNQLEAINAMVATYNHEINNPLCIALGSVEIGIRNQDIKYYKKARDALLRINEIVKKIKTITASDIEMTDYSSQSKMVKLSDSN